MEHTQSLTWDINKRSKTKIGKKLEDQTFYVFKSDPYFLFFLFIFFFPIFVSPFSYRRLRGLLQTWAAAIGRRRAWALAALRRRRRRWRLPRRRRLREPEVAGISGPATAEGRRRPPEDDGREPRF